MGRYIQTDSLKGKALVICEKFAGAVVTPAQAESMINSPDEVALICVVDNGPFEAAAYCYDEKEFKEFNDPNDRRPKTWVAALDVEKVRQAAP